jgi:glycosyltransferase involved in cell wall biosynthesis
VRILQVILSKGFRGAERHVAELAAAQAGRHEVLLLIRGDAAEGGVSIRDGLPSGLPVAELRRPFWWLRATRIARRFRPDILHAHGGRASRLIAQLPVAAPRLATMHLDYRPRWYRGLDALVAPTDWQRDQALSQGFAGVVQRINLWHEPAPPPAPDRIAALRAAWRAGPDTVVIGSVGALIPSKGMDLLVAAFRAADLPDARLVVAGQGPESERLDALAAGDPRIHLLGFRRDVADLYHAFDLFVAPARLEPFGLALLEALGAGCPVLATATAGAREILGPDGLVAPEPEALSAALRHRGRVRAPRVVADLSPWRRDVALDGLDALYARLVTARRG